MVEVKNQTQQNTNSPSAKQASAQNAGAPSTPFAQVPSFRLAKDIPREHQGHSWHKWVFLAIILAIAGMIILLIFIFFIMGRDQSTVPVSTQQINETIPEDQPQIPAVSTIEDEGKAQSLREYFSAVSANWKDEFFDIIPQVAADAYEDFIDAEAADKLEAAQDFYIYLNSPLAQNDQQFVSFLNDVKADLEKQVGKALF